jgi:hypothetical protein
MNKHSSKHLEALLEGKEEEFHNELVRDAFEETLNQYKQSNTGGNVEMKKDKIIVTGLGFDEILAVVKKTGQRAQRAGWNGKGQYVELATCISYKNLKGEIINPEHADIGNKAFAFVGTSGVQLGWVASQADLLAEDWQIIEYAEVAE